MAQLHQICPEPLIVIVNQEALPKFRPRMSGKDRETLMTEISGCCMQQRQCARCKVQMQVTRMEEAHYLILDFVSDGHNPYELSRSPTFTFADMQNARQGDVGCMLGCEDFNFVGYWRREVN